MYKKIFGKLSFEVAVYGSVIATTKLCESYRKTRDIVNAVAFELDGGPCMELNTVNFK